MVAVATQFSVNEWAERYMFTSLRGRVWTRAMVRKAVCDHLRLAGLLVKPALVDQVLDDDKFMLSNRGSIPARIVETVWAEARRRAGGR